MREDYPDLPLILLGHSMGSFIVRGAVRRHPDACDALIVMGTSGKNPLALPGLLISKIICKIKGENLFPHSFCQSLFLHIINIWKANTPMHG